MIGATIKIRHFTWDQWIPLNTLLNARLAEETGIITQNFTN